MNLRDNPRLMSGRQDLQSFIALGFIPQIFFLRSFFIYISPLLPTTYNSPPITHNFQTTTNNQQPITNDQRLMTNFLGLFFRPARRSFSVGGPARRIRQLAEKVEKKYLDYSSMGS